MTIFALSTGPGISGVAIIRISGPDCAKVVQLLTNKPIPRPRVATLRNINKIDTSELIDEGIILWFPGPESYTGEDMAEIQVHGSKAVIDALHSSISNIENCTLKNNSNNLVFADGDHNSNIMLIGEGPGQKEDEQGKPFVGDAGLLLNKMLAAINIKRNKVYVTNIVNYIPPENRKPNEVEINTYAPFIKKHISIINPKLIILLGSTAMETFFGNKEKISKSRGVWKELIVNNKTYLTMVTFHPAYLLRQPDQKKFSWVDLKEIKNKIQELKIGI